MATEGVTPSIHNTVPQDSVSSSQASTLAEQLSPGTNDPQSNGIEAPLLTWTSQIAASLSSLSEQIASASTVIGQNSYTPADPFADVATNSLNERFNAIEQMQARLEAELGEIKTRVIASETQAKDETGTQARVTELSAMVDELVATIKLDQLRLYPRLLNATVTVSKMPIKPLPAPGGKSPPNFPATRGEFEHLTKERYEDILTAYGLSIKGDTATKRETLRSFLGLPP